MDISLTMKYPKWIQTAILGLLVAAATNASSQNLVVNGDFELTSNGTNKMIHTSNTGYASNPSDTRMTRITGWSNFAAAGYGLIFAPGAADTVGAKDVFNVSTFKLWGSNNGGLDVITDSPTGGNFLAIDGDPDFRELFTQTLTGLVPGQSYQLDFDWAAGQQSLRSGATTEQFQINIGATTFLTAEISLPSHGFSGWMHQSYTFVADSATPTLGFLALGTPTGLPPLSLLDGVSILAVPESSTALLLGGVFGALLLRRRR